MYCGGRFVPVLLEFHCIVSTHIETVVLLSNKFEESKIYFDVGVEAKDYYRIKDRNKHN